MSARSSQFSILSPYLVPAACLFFIVALNWPLMEGARPHPDEGFYVGSVELAKSFKPYRDFFFNQGPGFLLCSTPVRWGLPGSWKAARMWSFGFCMATWALLLFWPGLLPSKGAEVLTVIGGLNLFIGYYGTLAKPYALVMFLFTAGALCLPGKSRSLQTLGAAFLALAALTRISFALPLLLGLVWLWLHPYKKGRWTATFAAAGIILIALWPYRDVSPGSLWYQTVTYLTAKDAIPLTRQLWFRFLQPWYFLQHLAPAALLAGWTFLAGSPSPEKKNPLKQRLFTREGFYLLLIAGVLLAHLPGKKPDLDTYLLPALPLALAFLVIKGMPRWIRVAPERGTAGFIVFLIFCMVYRVALSGEFAANGKVGGLESTATASQAIASHTPPDSSCLTFNQAIAVDAGRQIPLKYAMNTVRFEEGFEGNAVALGLTYTAGELFTALEGKEFGSLLLTENTFTHNFPRFRPLTEAEKAPLLQAIAANYQEKQCFPGLGYGGEEAILFVPITNDQ